MVREIRLAKDSNHAMPDSDIISGSTANVIAILHNKIYCANAGDSRSVLSLKKKAIPLSFDHKPDNPIEKARIYGAGGNITAGRIDGGLNLSRAIGDMEYKKREDLPPEKQKVTAFPDVTVHEIQGGEDFVFIGCDGVW
jgi:protein phosphatase 2C family protein 2/3